MNGWYKTIIVDDERLARMELIRLLRSHPEVEVVAEASGVSDAEKKITLHQPDLLFLDIQLRGETGFDLLTRTDFRGKIIFITAWDQYAVRAFETNALDYLLKPVSPERLAQSLRKLQAGEESQAKVLTRKFNPQDVIFLHFGKQLRFQRIDAILLLRAQGPYSELITTEGQTGLVNKSLKEWEQQLPESHFLRVHRNTIINLNRVAEVISWSNQGYRITMKDIPEPVVVSRRYAKRLREGI